MAIKIPDDEYDPIGGGSGGGGVPVPAPPPLPYWTPGTLINPGQYIEPTTPNGFRYKATQAAAAYTAGTEPAWPTTVGATVVDGGVTWTAEAKATITWTASPLLESGVSEPVWPMTAGGTVNDGSVQWVASPRYVQDNRCPNTYPVLIAASKVYAPGVKGDIVRYSATVAPLDWSTKQDAGYLPTGLQAYGSNPVMALGFYRGKVAPFNAEGMQVWDVDEDPANMALVDALPIGCLWPHAATPVSNDLLFLSLEGVRSVGIAAGTQNLKANDVGVPVDPIVKELVSTGAKPMSLYYPSAGQYWLLFPSEDRNETEVMVYTMSRTGAVGAWSRYLLLYCVQDWAIKGAYLYLRSADNVFRIDDTVTGDQLTHGGPFTPAPGVVQWPWLDMGSPSTEKMIESFDIVSTGDPSVTFGYDQNDPTAFTSPYEIPPDTVPGTPIPMPVAGPSFSVKVEFAGAIPWSLSALKINLSDSAL